MIEPVRSKKVFAQLTRDGKSVRNGPVRVRYLTSWQGPEGSSAGSRAPQVSVPEVSVPQVAAPQVAYAFGRRFGNAVERNRAKRRLREAFRNVWRADVDRGGVFLISGTRAVLSLPFPALTQSLRSCLDHAGREGTSRRCANE